MRVVALYAAVLLSVSHNGSGLGPVELGVVATVVCIWAALRPAGPVSLVHLVLRATSLTLLLAAAALWARQQPWGPAACALALSLSAQWWVEEDQRRRTAVEGTAWRAALLHEMHTVRRTVATTESRMGPAILDALRSMPRQIVLPDAGPRRRAPAHRSRNGHRPGAHRARDSRPRPAAARLPARRRFPRS